MGQFVDGNVVCVMLAYPYSGFHVEFDRNDQTLRALNFVIFLCSH